MAKLSIKVDLFSNICRRFHQLTVCLNALLYGT